MLVKNERKHWKGSYCHRVIMKMILTLKSFWAILLPRHCLLCCGSTPYLVWLGHPARISFWNWLNLTIWSLKHQAKNSKLTSHIAWKELLCTFLTSGKYEYNIKGVTTKIILRKIRLEKYQNSVNVETNFGSLATYLWFPSREWAENSTWARWHLPHSQPSHAQRSSHLWADPWWWTWSCRSDLCLPRSSPQLKLVKETGKKSDVEWSNTSESSQSTQCEYYVYFDLESDYLCGPFSYT